MGKLLAKRILSTAIITLNVYSPIQLFPARAIDHTTFPINPIGLFPARAAIDPNEQLRKAAAYLPGMGQPDVYYPSIYLGEWFCEQELTEIAPGEGTEAGGELELLHRYEDSVSKGTKKLYYRRMYSEHEGNVVLDRGITSTNFFNALAFSSGNDDKWVATFDPSNRYLIHILLTVPML